MEKGWFGHKTDMLKPAIEAPKIGGSIHEVSKAEVTPEGLKIYMRTKVDEVRVTVPDSWQKMCADLAKARGYQPEIEGHDKDKGIDR